MDASEFFRAGRLQDAIDAAAAAVKAKPNDVSSRSLLCDLLCCAADFERADKQLDTLSHLQPEFAVAVAMSRQLVRSARWRQQAFESGRLPEFAEKPSAAVEQHLQVMVHMRAGDLPAASAALASAEGLRPRLSGVCDGQPFDGLRDLDDVLAPVLEVFTSNGKYYWIELRQVESLDLEPVRRVRDLLWRPARIAVRNGPDGPVHLPVLYPGTEKSVDDSLRLARSTAWDGEAHGPIRGLGQRMLLVGDDARPFLEIQKLAVAAQNPVT